MLGQAALPDASVQGLREPPGTLGGHREARVTTEQSG